MIDLPYSCRAGSCSACVAKLISGNVVQWQSKFFDWWTNRIRLCFIVLCISYIRLYFWNSQRGWSGVTTYKITFRTQGGKEYTIQCSNDMYILDAVDEYNRNLDLKRRVLIKIVGDQY